MTDQNNSFSFESGMTALRKIIGTLENGNISLNESVKAYQTATDIGAILTKQLNEAKNQVKTAKIMTSKGEEPYNRDVNGHDANNQVSGNGQLNINDKQNTVNPNNN